MITNKQRIEQDEQYEQAARMIADVNIGLLDRAIQIARAGYRPYLKATKLNEYAKLVLHDLEQVKAYIEAAVAYEHALEMMQ